MKTDASDRSPWWSGHFQWQVAGAAMIANIALTACITSTGRERATKNAIEAVKETMAVAVPELTHPEPYLYTGGGGDCAWVPGWNSSNEILSYQAELTLPAGDDGVDRQARAIKHWTDKGAEIRELPHRTGPPSEVVYGGGRIVVFAMRERGRIQDPNAPAAFYVSVSTPCVPKDQ